MPRRSTGISHSCRGSPSSLCFRLWIDWLFVCCFTVPLKNCRFYEETFPMSVEGCTVLVYVWRLWPLSRDGSLSCHTCSDWTSFFAVSFLKLSLITCKPYKGTDETKNTYNERQVLIWRVLIVTCCDCISFSFITWEWIHCVKLNATGSV